MCTQGVGVEVGCLACLLMAAMPEHGRSRVHSFCLHLQMDFIILFFNLKCGSDSEEFACNAGDQSLIPVLGRSTGEGSGNLLQYSCLENSMDRGAWRATVHGVGRSWACLRDEHFHFSLS